MTTAHCDAFLDGLPKSDLEVIVWRTKDETPILMSFIDLTAKPPHAVTLQVMSTEDGAPRDGEPTDL